MKKIIFTLLLPFLFGCSSLKAENEKMAPCPSSPNCVISDSADAKHYLEPIKIGNISQAEANKKLVKAIEYLGGKITVNDGNYIKASFYSKFFHFEDIAEFQIDEEKGLIEVRSAAQSGWYDFGVNRKRMEKIRSMI